MIDQASEFRPPEDAIVPQGAEFAWEAFWRLHHDRPYVVTGVSSPMGATVIEPRPGRIPFSVIDQYAQRYGIGGSAFEILVDLLEKLDREFLSWDSEQAAARAARRK